MKSPPEFEENVEFLKIEDKINDMLNKVMEEDDSLDYLDFGYDEMEDNSQEISRISTRHQTSDLPFQTNFNRQNKRNLTEVLNTKEHLPYFNTEFKPVNSPILKNTSFSFQNPINNNIFSLNNLNNSLYNKNIANNILCFNNTTNLSLPILSFNNQANNNQINNNNNNNNHFKNEIPFSKSVVSNEQRNLFINDSRSLFNFNKFVDNNQNINKGNNNNRNTYFSSKLNSENFKRNENRKKTYDIPVLFKNNISDCLKNINIINNNQRIDNSLPAKIDFEYENNQNNIIYPVPDSFINELKNILEKNGKIDYYIYSLIKGKFLSILKNHKGSKLFQKYIKSTNPEEIIHLLYVELSQNLCDFITDGYSNYFCKKFFIFLNQKDRIDFLKKIENSIVKFSCDSVGTYPIQTIIENLNSNIEKFIVINAIKNHVEELANDPFGCHVLEKLLNYVEEENISFLYSFISNNFLELANNSNGICLVKKILSFTNKKNLHEKIKQFVIDNAYELIRHQYGNFVIQGIVEFWSDYKEIMNLYKNNFINLSLEKYASNVIERFIEKDEDALNEFIGEIIKSNKIYDIMKSSFGNYVIQKIIKLAKNENKNKIVFCAAKNINNLMENKLILKWKSLLQPHIIELNYEEIEELKLENYFEN